MTRSIGNETTTVDKRRETRGKVLVAARPLFIVETIEPVAYYDGPLFHLSSRPYPSLSQTPYSPFRTVRPDRSLVSASSVRFEAQLVGLVNERPPRESCMNGMKETGIERERWWEGRMIDVWMEEGKMEEGTNKSHGGRIHSIGCWWLLVIIVGCTRRWEGSGSAGVSLSIRRSGVEEREEIQG